MKTNHLVFDDVADSMSAAAGRLGVPLEAIKAAKRSGSRAFHGSRVNVTQLRQEIASAEKGPTTADVLLIVAHDVAERVSYALTRCPGKRFRTDSDKLCQAIHNGFAVALCIVEPDAADDFLRESSAMFESVFQKRARKKLGVSRSIEKEWQRRKLNRNKRDRQKTLAYRRANAENQSRRFEKAVRFIWTARPPNSER